MIINIIVKNKEIYIHFQIMCVHTFIFQKSIWLQRL